MEFMQIVGIDSEIGSVKQPEDDSFPAEEIINCENPKIIEWEELQHELARICSFSSALEKAKELKESLSQRLESVIQPKAARQKYLQQSNELDDMRQKLEARKLAMGEMAMQMRETKVDMTCKKEQLGIALGLLLVAGKKVYAAHQQLQEANKLVIGKMGLGNIKSLQKTLRTRQQHMITQVGLLYPVKSSNENASKEKFDRHCEDEEKSSMPETSMPHSVSSMTILGIQLTALPPRKASFFRDKKEIQRSSVVLGYVSHAVSLIASYLDVPLRYPLRLGGSNSHIRDYAPSIETSASDLIVSSSIAGKSAKPTEFPLFLEGQDSTRAAYAIFLLNKDLEQLLNFLGGESVGPRHVLANLQELMKIIQSPDFLGK